MLVLVVVTLNGQTTFFDHRYDALHNSVGRVRGYNFVQTGVLDEAVTQVFFNQISQTIEFVSTHRLYQSAVDFRNLMFCQSQVFNWLVLSRLT